MNKALKYFGAGLIALLIVLVFMSKTIYTYNIPKVTTVMPTNGKLKREEIVSGTARFAEVQEKYFPLSGYVEEVYVSEGDRVSQGQAIAEFRFDRDDLISQLEKLALEKSSLNLSVENIHLKIDSLTKEITRLENETYELDEVSLFEMQKQQNRINSKLEEYERMEILYEAGAATKVELEKLKNEIEEMEEDYAKLVYDLKEEGEKAKKKQEDEEADRRKKIESLYEDIDNCRQELKAKDLEAQGIRLSEETINKTLAEFNENQMLYAPADGVILFLDIKKGQYLNGNQMIFSLGTGEEFLIECEVGATNNYIDTGDICRITNADKNFEGSVSKLEVTETGKKVTVRVQSAEITQGETFNVKFQKDSGNSYTLVPNGAVNMDSGGHFIYLIKTRNGILGEEYYVFKTAVQIGDSDNENTVITSGITFFEPIVGYTDKPLTNSLTVNVKNAGDLLVK